VIRFPVQATAVFWWIDANGILQHGEGHIRDVSERGVFVVSDDCPPLGARVGLEFCLERFPGTTHSLGIHVDGHVLRVDELSEGRMGCGFAILNDDAMLEEKLGS
jgi:hypothetical protein